MTTLLSCFIWFLVTCNEIYAQKLPDARAATVSELESLYFDNIPAGFFSGVTPCTTYIDSTTARPNNSLGRQTAAQWIRSGFHDFVTADAGRGTGGLDASIGFETLRPENIGVALNDSIFFFQFFFNDRTSMADLIALGTVVAVGACGGPNVPYRGGRVDATSASSLHVCKPETDINETLDIFSSAGFSQEDAIGVTACGHSMGGVRHASFPEIVPENTVSDDNLDGRLPFDESVATFDGNVVQEYLSGTGARGGPLVTTTNETDRSDLRLYASDENRTMESLAQSKDKFASTCSELLARMIDTVPSEVSFTPLIKPSDMRLTHPLLDINSNGTLSLSASIMYMDIAASKPAPKSLSVSIKHRNGKASSPAFQVPTNFTDDKSTGIFGPTHAYPVTKSFSASTGMSGLVVEGKTFALQDSIFVVTSRSSVNSGFAAFANQLEVQPFAIKITVAALKASSHSSLTATFAFQVPQPGNLVPRMDHSTTLRLDPVGHSGPYTLFSGLLTRNMNAVQMLGSSVDVAAEGMQSKLAFFKLFDLMH